MDENRARRVAEALRRHGVDASLKKAGVYQFGISVHLPDGREAVWDSDGSAGLEATVMADGMLRGFVPTIEGSEHFTDEQVVEAIWHTDYDAPDRPPARDRAAQRAAAAAAGRGVPALPGRLPLLSRGRPVWRCDHGADDQTTTTPAVPQRAPLTMMAPLRVSGSTSHRQPRSPRHSHPEEPRGHQSRPRPGSRAPGSAPGSRPGRTLARTCLAAGVLEDRHQPAVADADAGGAAHRERDDPSSAWDGRQSCVTKGVKPVFGRAADPPRLGPGRSAAAAEEGGTTRPR